MNSDVVNLTNATTLSADPKKAAKKELGKDDFMKLLLTQMSAQDPLNPTDSTEFVAQLAQFSSLEGITNMGGKLDSLINISGASNAANAVSLLGKDVRLASNEISGSSTVYYELAAGAATAKIEVLDKSGNVVKVLEDLPTATGIQEVKIEGLDKGSYTFRVQAKDVQGSDISSFVSTSERVRAVNFSGNIPILLLESGNQMPANQVVEIRQPREM